MIVNFIGEFLFHPAPLEMSGNTCTHGCAYCFANIRKESRYAKINSAFNQLKRREIKTFVDHLIQNGYPICLSNSTDPFSATDYVNTIALSQHLKDLPNGIFWQTKGGHGVDEVLEILKDKKEQVWYITLTTLDPETAKRVESNAPTPQERLDLMVRLRKLGYTVIIALNPLVEEWMPVEDIDRLITFGNENGIDHFVVEQLHLNRKEIASFKPNRRAKFKDEELAKVLEHKADLKYARDMVDRIESAGLLPMKIGMPKKSLFFDQIRKVFGKISPNHFDVINYCFDHNTPEGFVLTYDRFRDVMTKGIEDMFFTKYNGFKSYVFKASAHEWIKNDKVKEIETLEDVLKVVWNAKKIKQSLQHNALFRKWLDADGNDVLDEEGNITLYFDGVVRRTKDDRVLKMLAEDMTYDKCKL